MRTQAAFQELKVYFYHINLLECTIRDRDDKEGKEIVDGIRSER